MILEAWPALKALRKEDDSYWEEFDPRFRVVHPYRPRKPKQTPQLELSLGAVQVKSSVSEQRRRAFDSFRFSLPKPIAAAVKKFQNRQWVLLKLMQKVESALELARLNPALCFSLANYHQFGCRSTTLERAACLASRRQREISEWLGFPGTVSTAKILSRIPPESASLELLKPLSRAMHDPDFTKILSHQPVLNAGVISILLVEGFRNGATPAFLSEVAKIPAEKYRASIVEMLVDTLKMLQEVKPNAGTPKIQSLARLRSMHDEVSAEYLRNLPPRSRSEPLPTPPLRGTKTIIPILTFDELSQESRAQQNCVATYAERIRKRTTFVYRVTHPERATLSIVRSHSGDWQIGELECGANTEVSPITRIAVESWLGQFALSI